MCIRDRCGFLSGRTVCSHVRLAASCKRPQQKRPSQQQRKQFDFLHSLENSFQQKRRHPLSFLKADTFLVSYSNKHKKIRKCHTLPASARSPASYRDFCEHNDYHTGQKLICQLSLFHPFPVQKRFAPYSAWYWPSNHSTALESPSSVNG